MAAALSFIDCVHIDPLDFIPGWEGMTFFDTIDFSIVNLLLPIKGLLISLFAGWVLPKVLVTAALDGNQFSQSHRQRLYPGGTPGTGGDLVMARLKALPGMSCATP